MHSHRPTDVVRQLHYSTWRQCRHHRCRCVRLGRGSGTAAVLLVSLWTLCVGGQAGAATATATTATTTPTTPTTPTVTNKVLDGGVATSVATATETATKEEEEGEDAANLDASMDDEARVEEEMEEYQDRDDDTDTLSNDNADFGYVEEAEYDNGGDCGGEGDGDGEEKAKGQEEEKEETCEAGKYAADDGKAKADANADAKADAMNDVGSDATPMGSGLPLIEDDQTPRVGGANERGMDGTTTTFTKKSSRRPKKKKKKKKPKPPPPPPPIIKDVEVVQKVHRTRYVQQLTPEQIVLLNDEQRLWEDELSTLERLASGGASHHDLMRASPTLGTAGVTLALYRARLDRELAAASTRRSNLAGRMSARARKLGELLRDQVDALDHAASDASELVASCGEKRRKALSLLSSTDGDSSDGDEGNGVGESLYKTLADLKSLLSVPFLGNITTKELVSTYEQVLANIDEWMSEPPPPISTNEEGAEAVAALTMKLWEWNPTADAGAALEATGVVVGVVDGNNESGSGCDMDAMIRQDLPPLPHVPSKDVGYDVVVNGEYVYNVDYEEEEEEGDNSGNYMDMMSPPARESDLFTLVGSIESVLRDRTGRYEVTNVSDDDFMPGPLSTDDGEDRFFDALDSMSRKARDEVDGLRRKRMEVERGLVGGEDGGVGGEGEEKGALVREGGMKICVDGDGVEELVLGGLEALLRRKDLKEELEKIVNDMYAGRGGGDFRPNTNTLNLDMPPDNTSRDFRRDAASPLSSSSSSSSSSFRSLWSGGGASMDRAMLRRIADDPLLRQLADGLDRVAEAAVGHFDPVDRVIDLISGQDADGSVGRTVEDVIRKSLDMIEVPDMAREMREKAGVLFDRV